MPFMRERRDILGYVLGGWELSGKTRWQSGQYLTVIGNTSIATRRADYLGGEISLPADDRNENRWFNTSVFATAPNDRRGNSPIGLIEGPHWQQWDISLRKVFRTQGSAKITLRADVFNVFNRVNFMNPNTTVTSSAFGTITQARIPRQTQLSLKFEF
jgi:hypothetical protein